MYIFHRRSILLEGCKATTAPLVCEIWREGGKVVSMQLPLSIAGVEDFYRWINLRGAVGGTEKRHADMSVPFNLPDSETNGKSVFFLHGFNVSENESRGWHSEMFKRLWQSGSNAKFHAVTWYGDKADSGATELHYQSIVCGCAADAGTPE